MKPHIIYRDDLEFPWVLIYGADQVWARYRNRKGAERDLRRINKLLDYLNGR